jgi:hypothetical protein
MRKAGFQELTPAKNAGQAHVPTLTKRGAFEIVINSPLLLLREGAGG